jgi:hypothetical protein
VRTSELANLFLSNGPKMSRIFIPFLLEDQDGANNNNNKNNNIFSSI